MKVNLDNYFEVAEAIYCYCILNHDGQWSELYKILSNLGFVPGMGWSETLCLEENQYVGDLTDKSCIALHEALEEFLSSEAYRAS